MKRSFFRTKEEREFVITAACWRDSNILEVEYLDETSRAHMLEAFERLKDETKSLLRHYDKVTCVFEVNGNPRRSFELQRQGPD